MYHNMNSFERFCDVVRNESLHDTAAFPFELKHIFEENDLAIVNEKLIKITLWMDENIGINKWSFGKTNISYSAPTYAMVQFLFLFEESALAFKLRWS